MGTVCVWYSARRRNWVSNGCQEVYLTTVDIFNKNNRFTRQIFNTRTYWEVRAPLLDLTETVCEVVRGQQLVLVEGFPASDRTERRSPPRNHRALKDSLRGQREVSEKIENTTSSFFFIWLF